MTKKIISGDLSTKSIFVLHVSTLLVFVLLVCEESQWRGVIYMNCNRPNQSTANGRSHL